MRNKGSLFFKTGLILILALATFFFRLSRVETTLSKIENGETAPQYEVYASMNFDGREIEFCKLIDDAYSIDLVIRDEDRIYENIHEFSSRDYGEYLYFDEGSELQILADGQVLQPQKEFVTSKGDLISVYVLERSSEINAQKKETADVIIETDYKSKKQASFTLKELDSLMSDWQQVDVPPIVIDDELITCTFNEYIYEAATNRFHPIEWTFSTTDKAEYSDCIVVKKESVQAYQLTNEQWKCLFELIENKD